MSKYARQRGLGLVAWGSPEGTMYAGGTPGFYDNPLHLDQQLIGPRDLGVKVEPPPSSAPVPTPTALPEWALPLGIVAVLVGVLWLR